MEYFDDEGYLEVGFSGFIEPLITNLTKNQYYTTISINEAIRFRSFYTIRLFELLMQYKNSSKLKIITVEDLRNTFQIAPDKHTRFTDFRRYVLVPSVAEIQKKTDWIVMWEPIKKGRTITGIKLSFELNEQTSFEDF